MYYFKYANYKKDLTTAGQNNKLWNSFFAKNAKKKLINVKLPEHNLTNDAKKYPWKHRVTSLQTYCDFIVFEVVSLQRLLKACFKVVQT